MKDSTYTNILVITIGFTIIGLVTRYTWPFYIAASAGILALISSHIAELINKQWLGLAKILGYINSRILLTLIYYLFLLPMALISRMAGSNPIRLKRHSKTYFASRDHHYVKEDLENPW